VVLVIGGRCGGGGWRTGTVETAYGGEVVGLYGSVAYVLADVAVATED